MEQIILIDNNSALKDLLISNLTTYLKAEVIPRNSASEAIDLLNILPCVKIIICQNVINNENTAKIIDDYIKAENKNIQMIVVGQSNENFSHKSFVIDEKKQWQDIVYKSAEILNIDKKILQKNITPRYVTVPIEHFISLSSSCCDVYIRIKKGKKYEFIKRLHATDDFSQETIQKYINLGLENLYISENNTEHFETYLSNHHVSALENIDDSTDFSEQVKIIEGSYDVATHQISKQGFTRATTQLTDSIIKTLLDPKEPTTAISKFLYTIINNSSNELYRLFHMISIVASEMVTELNYKEKTKQMQTKIIFAAFFHDMALIDHPNLFDIYDRNDIQNSDLTESELQIYDNHAYESAQIISKYSSMPDGVEEIIIQHHGSKDGKSIPNLTEHGLNELSKVLIIAEEFSRIMLLQAEELKQGNKLRPITSILYEKYKRSDLIGTILLLEKMLKDRTNSLEILSQKKDTFKISAT